jgi:hypothetical protein
MVYAENRVRQTATMTFVSSLLGIIGSCFCASYWGAVGCAACSGIALIIYEIWVNYFYHKELDINIKTFFSSCHLKILPILLVIGAIFFVVINYLNFVSWTGLVVAACLYVVIYATVCYFFLFNDYEKNLMKNLFIRK